MEVSCTLIKANNASEQINTGAVQPPQHTVADWLI